MMTKKDYQKFAKMFNQRISGIKESYLFGEDSLWTGGREVELNTIIDLTVQIFMQDNKNFSPSAFRSACQPKEK